MRDNILTAHYTDGDINVIGTLYQFDYGQRIVFEGIELPSAYEVHFSNAERGTSYSMIGDETGVDIPDVLLQTGKDVYVWIYLHTGDADGETVYRFVIDVRKRAAPIHDEPTPVQQSEIEQAIAALNAGVSTVESIAEGIPGAIDDALQEAKDSGEFDGEDGFSPVVTVTPIEDGHEVSIQDAETTHVFDVMNGMDGRAADVIDDTTGAGDTDKTWSADKLVTDFSNKADKADTVLTSTLSRGRKSGTSVGTGSFAFGINVEASGDYAHAEGTSTVASGSDSHAEGTIAVASGNSSHAEGSNAQATGQQSHAEGASTVASGMRSHSEGYRTTASGNNAHSEGDRTQATAYDSHSEGRETVASGEYSHAQGYGTIASGYSSDVSGKYNIADSYDNWNEWVANTQYNVGDKVKRTGVSVSAYVCKIANSDSSFALSKWTKVDGMNYLEIVGNGTADNARSNARTLDWDGNEYLAGDLYVRCNSDSTGGYKVATLDANGKVDLSQLPSYVDDVVEYASLANFPATGETGKIYVALDTNKTYRWSGSAYIEIGGSGTIVDVQVNGASVVSSGVANILVASTTETQAIINEYGVVSA